MDRLSFRVGRGVASLSGSLPLLPLLLLLLLGPSEELEGREKRADELESSVEEDAGC